MRIEAAHYQNLELHEARMTAAKTERDPVRNTAGGKNSERNKWGPEISPSRFQLTSAPVISAWCSWLGRK